jgi:prolyl-tRNA editing enzyme YbaK/EbsC (Cys-tRNA(Pro) deacylase)
MLDRVVRYLHDATVAFRVVSFPSPEPLPEVAYSLPPGGLLIDTRVVLIGAQPAIACTRQGVPLSYARLATFLREPVLHADSGDLQGEIAKAGDPVPPLGGLVGAPIFIDEDATETAIIVFRAFAPNDFIELSYEDFARVERPIVASFGRAGELPAAEAAR